MQGITSDSFPCVPVPHHTFIRGPLTKHYAYLVALPRAIMAEVLLHVGRKQLSLSPTMIKVSPCIRCKPRLSHCGEYSTRP